MPCCSYLETQALGTGNITTRGRPYTWSWNLANADPNKNLLHLGACDSPVYRKIMYLRVCVYLL